MGFIRMPRFIRRFIRRRTSQIPYEVAVNKRKVLSLAYAFLAWNIFGLVCYDLWKTKRPENSEERRSIALWRGNIYTSVTPQTYVVNVPNLSTKLVETSQEPALEPSSEEN